MHCIGSSLCFWVNTIIDETMDSLVEKLTKPDDNCHNDTYVHDEPFVPYHGIFWVIFSPMIIRIKYYAKHWFVLYLIIILSLIFLGDTSFFEECDINNSTALKNNTDLKKCVQKISNWTETCLNIAEDEPVFSFNVDCLLARECMCTYDNHAANSIFEFGPYLYPFSIEFSILVG